MQKNNCDVTEAEKYILDIPKFTRKNDLSKTKDFLLRLGNPGIDKKIIHVAGTNGKGSVCAYLNTILIDAGYKVGMFTSPHLEKIQERFQINGIPISDEEFVARYLEVRKEIEQKQGEDGNNYHPTFFEFLFFMGMLIFKDRDVDYIILETGLGGRLDATNVLEKPTVCAITKIGLDHTEYLGDTLAKVAFEKAGIIKEGIPVVYYDYCAEVSQVIADTAENHHSQAYKVNKNDYHISKIKKKSIDFSIDSGYYGYISLTLGTCALYQVQNATIAIKIIEILNSQSGKITKENITRGVKDMFWKGRMEEILPGVYLDGAHNEDGMEAFLETVKARNTAHNASLLFSVVAEKDYTHMVQDIMESRLFREIIVTKIKNNRALPMEKLESLFKQYNDTNVTYIEDTQEAFFYGLKKKGKKDTLYIAGSLYLAGQIETMCHEKGNVTGVYPALT